MSFADQENMPPISKELFHLIRTYVPKGETILEFGSGPGSTMELKPFYNLYSVEHTPWCKFNEEDHYFRCPLDAYNYPNEEITLWYRMETVIEALKVPYKAILFDGPDTETRMIPVVIHHEIFNKDVHWFFDDWNIEKIRNGIKRLQEVTGRELLLSEVGAKKFAILLGEGK